VWIKCVSASSSQLINIKAAGWSAHLEIGVGDNLRLGLHPDVAQSSAPLPHRVDLSVCHQHREPAGPRPKLVSVHHHLQETGWEICNFLLFFKIQVIHEKEKSQNCEEMSVTHLARVCNVGGLESGTLERGPVIGETPIRDSDIQEVTCNDNIQILIITFALKMRKVMFWSPCIYLFICLYACYSHN